MIHTFSLLRPRSLLAAALCWAVGLVFVHDGARPAGAVTLAPLASFGGGDGWLSPGEGGYLYLGTGNLERGLAYGNDHLYLVSRNNPTSTNGNNVRILDSTIGVDLNTGLDLGALDTTGGIISGGVFGVDMVAVGGDGAIYVGNLQTNTSVGLYKVYRWADEVSTATVAYGGDAGITAGRIGDDLAAIGSGSSTLLVAGYGNNPAVAGNNGYAIIDPTAGTATAVAFAGTPPNAGDFRLGITFTDSSHVIGSQGNSIYTYTSFSGSSGTLIATPTLTFPGGVTAERLLAYTEIGGNPILAVQSTGDSHVSIYSVADPTNPLFLTSGNNTTTPASNPNATGDLAWGATTANEDGSISKNLYAMSTNQGIQAFTVTLPAPPTVPGDYNNNGIVDAADYIVWRKTLNQPAVPAGTGADGNGDGTVGPDDFDYWRARFGNTTGSGLGAGEVPEPSAFMLVAVAALGAIARRRRR